MEPRSLELLVNIHLQILLSGQILNRERERERERDSVCGASCNLSTIKK